MDKINIKIKEIELDIDLSGNILKEIIGKIDIGYKEDENDWQCTVTGLGSENPQDVHFEHKGKIPNFEEVEFNGDKFIKIPTMYRKINAVDDGQITSFTIATTNIDGSYLPYSCFVKEDGVTIMPYILIGKYYSNTSKGCNSIDEKCVKYQTISNGRTQARAKGAGYQLYDWQIHKLWQDIIICVTGTIDINNGEGVVYDKVGIYWDYSGQWIDGIAQDGNEWLLCYEPSKYYDKPKISSMGYKVLGYRTPNNNGNITKLGYDKNNPFANFPNCVENHSYITYYKNYYWGNGDENTPVYSYVGLDYAYPGAFSCYADFEWSYTRGVRLCYRPL